MAIKKTKSKKSLNRPHECKFCNKGFSSEKTLSAHMCPKKRRYTDRHTPGAQLGFRTFQQFYKLTTNAKKPKTEMEFISSRYYIDFVKFGRYLIDLNPINAEDFIVYLIRNAVPLKKWTAEESYQSYLECYSKKELPEKAIERTILTMVKWANENNDEYQNFFKHVHPVEATFLIRGGHISPWALYIADTAENLFDRFTDEQGDIISGIIDPTHWASEILKRKDDVAFIRNILQSAGL